MGWRGEDKECVKNILGFLAYHSYIDAFKFPALVMTYTRQGTGYLECALPRVAHRENPALDPPGEPCWSHLVWYKPVVDVCF